jgi:hypothetical protein
MATTKSDYTLETQSAVYVSALTNVKDSATISISDNLIKPSSMLSFYFKISVIVLGVLGTVANGSTLWALVFNKQVKKFSFIIMVRT